jgi:hypothetical protein
MFSVQYKEESLNVEDKMEYLPKSIISGIYDKFIKKEFL